MGIDDALDNMASSFWCMFDRPEREIQPVPSEDAYSFPECDYDRNPTNLYKQIENQNWTSVNHFLLTGYWSGSFFKDGTTPTEQACTWVTKYDPSSRRKKVMWTHLPIHAALSYGAPEGVVQLMVKLAPPTLRCADDQRMLPLHLAFRRGATDNTIAIIMDVFPEGVAVRDFMGRTPSDCASESPNPRRGTIIQTVLYYNQRAWEKKMAKQDNDEIEAFQQSLLQRNERIDHLQTAFELMQCRESQSRESFKVVMAELSKLKCWYEEQNPRTGLLSASAVNELTERLDNLRDTAQGLNVQQIKSKRESDRTLKQLKTIWQSSEFSDDLKLQKFADKNMPAKAKQDIQSDASSNTSLITSSTANKDDMVEPVEPEQQVEEPAEEPQEAKEEKLEVEAPKEEPQEPEEPQANPKNVPAEIEDGSLIKYTISEMTSLDMSDQGSKTTSKSATMNAFKKGLKKITKKASKKDSSKKPSDASLPSKTPSTQSKSKKPSKLSVLTGGGGSVKITPTL